MTSTDQSRFLRCPRCDGKTRTRVLEDTLLRRFPLYCPKCRYECIVTYRNGMLTITSEPGAVVH